MIGRPPVVLETLASPFGRGPSAQVDRHALRPLGDYLRATSSRPSMSDDPEPTMFGTGDLPIFCASGVDVDVLRWVHWSARHAAAMDPDPALVWRLVEETAAGVEPSGTPAGDAALRDYIGRVWRWAIAPAPSPVGEFTPENYEAFWGGETQ